MYKRQSYPEKPMLKILPSYCYRVTLYESFTVLEIQYTDLETEYRSVKYRAVEKIQSNFRFDSQGITAC